MACFYFSIILCFLLLWVRSAVSERHLTLNAGNWNCDRRRYPEEKGVGESRAMGMGGCQGTSTQLTIETDRSFGGEIE